ncbi:MAG: NAD(P)H-dependent oxidoreductase [Chitinophaga sp.]|uniref:NADPH-dependent FMN reductase n=1 Tax=Chitinophaga sp. TaxID=1869181 RepID=UPI0025BC4553|nr:NADPH-dependent FMN reductase [Chitinophaga sp.]MBV8255291.1 NAD(P)H-dependent oxidoreductase [Chitinophaga sp.]
MSAPIKILAISGSTRKQSSNHLLIKALATLYKERVAIDIFEGLTELPHFNPDLDMDIEHAPAPVTDFRAQIRAADAVLICTPEYAIGVPGTLKNAIDWTVSSMEFSKKPVALITAGTSGYHEHKSLLGTLLMIESRISEEMQLVIPAVKTKINNEPVITHMETLMRLEQLMTALIAAVHAGEDAEGFLKPPPINQA